MVGRPARRRHGVVGPAGRTPARDASGRPAPDSTSSPVVPRHAQPGNSKLGVTESDSPPGGHCYWARLRDSGGSDIIANNLTEGPTRLTAVAGEYLEVNGCTFVTA